MTIKNLRIHFQGKTYDLAVELLGEPAAPAVPATPVLRAVPPPSAPAVEAAAPAPVAAPVAVTPVEAAAPAADGKGTPIAAPLSGTVVGVHVEPGQTVKYGDLLVTVEAMKMNTAVRATSAGRVAAIHARKGASVVEGTVLVVLG